MGDALIIRDSDYENSENRNNSCLDIYKVLCFKCLSLLNFMWFDFCFDKRENTMWKNNIFIFIIWCLWKSLYLPFTVYRDFSLNYSSTFTKIKDAFL